MNRTYPYNTLFLIIKSIIIKQNDLLQKPQRKIRTYKNWQA